MPRPRIGHTRMPYVTVVVSPLPRTDSQDFRGRAKRVGSRASSIELVSIRHLTSEAPRNDYHTNLHRLRELVLRNSRSAGTRLINIAVRNMC